VASRREHNGQADRPQAPTDAAGWVARMGSDQRTRDDELALRQWLDAEPGREDAYASHANLWEAAGELASDPQARAVLRHGRDHAVHPRFSRRAALGFFGAAAAASVAVLVAPQIAEWRGLYRTEVGETRHVTLADGSEMTLDTATRVQVDFSDAERRLTLESGQAYFNVAKDAGRPFRVFVGDDEVRAIGTAFAVRKDGERARVTLEEGVVAVYRAAPSTAAANATPKPAAILRPGEQAVLTPAEPVQVAAVDVRREQAWRYGRLMLDSSSLGDAVSEINRYGGRTIVLNDPALAQLKVSGVFHTRRPETFVEAMTTALDIRVVHEDDRELVLGRADPAAPAP